MIVTIPTKIKTPERCEEVIQQRLDQLGLNQEENISIFYDVLGLTMKKIRLRKDKATDTIANYQSTHQILQQNGGLAMQARNSSNTLHDTIYYQDNAGESASFEITLNAGSGAKYFTTSQSYGVGHTNVGYSLRVSGTLKLASAMNDGINFNPNTGTLEGGTIKIYEYEFDKDRFI